MLRLVLRTVPTPPSLALCARVEAWLAARQRAQRPPGPRREA